MGAEVNMVDYAGVGGYDEDRVLEWEEGLPGVDDITPLSQILIPPGLATAFNIKPEPFRTLVDVNRASRDTLSSLRGSQQPAFVRNEFRPFNENNGSRDSIMEGIDEDRSDSRRIRRMESMDEEDSTLRGENSNMGDDPSARALKRPRLVWTPQLHKRFVDVVSHLGIKNAVPKTTMQMMNVEGLTRENVASHLQKYRLYLKRMQGFSNEGPSSSDQLFASTPVPQSLRDSGSSGHTNGHVQMPVPVPYGSAMVPMQMLGHGQMGMPLSGYSGMEAHHQHAYGMMQQRNWSGLSYTHAPSQK